MLRQSHGGCSGAQEGVLLLVHGEVTDPDVDFFDREAVFIDRHLAPLLDKVGKSPQSVSGSNFESGCPSARCTRRRVGVPEVRLLQRVSTTQSQGSSS